MLKEDCSYSSTYSDTSSKILRYFDEARSLSSLRVEHDFLTKPISYRAKVCKIVGTWYSVFYFGFWVLGFGF